MAPSLIIALGRLRQEDPEFQFSLGYIGRRSQTITKAYKSHHGVKSLREGMREETGLIARHPVGWD